MPEQKQKKTIVNAHAHVFTHEHVPPFLARSIVLWPFYYLIHVPLFVKLYIRYNAYKTRHYKFGYKRTVRKIGTIKRYLLQNYFTRFISYCFLIWIVITTFFIFAFLLSGPLLDAEEPSSFMEIVRKIANKLEQWHLLFKRPEWIPIWLNVSFGIAVLFFVKSARKIVFFLLHQIRGFLHLLPGKDTKELLQRYLEMARFATYNKQSGIYSKLNRQYPKGTEFVLLPMDMEYMGAGKVKMPYYEQLKVLATINKKKEVHAFVFIDPRRIREEKEKFLDYSFENGTVTLKKSIVQKYIEEEKFAGFKIYPALGYFPFDADLLPLWKYAADNGIPIMSHGIKGVIYYRGWIKKEWNTHPVFTELLGTNESKPLYFRGQKNNEFQTNFTHPMNFLCLLEEPLLRKLVGEGSSEENKRLFGFTNMETPLKHNLSQLKICYAHFGGAEEWKRFLERDRDNYSQQLMADPATGINFGKEDKDKMPWGRYEAVWKYTDWYSIICSMMIQYENFYADISYIVSEPSLYPILRSTISSASSFENNFTKELTYSSREKLRKRVLFGSDFYVVRSQKSDKDIFIELTSYLTEEEFDLIARDNPHEYLKTNR